MFSRLALITVEVRMTL